MKKTKVFSITTKDLKIQTFCAGGKGGQKQNKVQTGVRIIHELSGAVGEARDARDQKQNKRAAFERMTKTKEFIDWMELQKEIIRGNIKYEEFKDGEFHEKSLQPGKEK